MDSDMVRRWIWSDDDDDDYDELGLFDLLTAETLSHSSLTSSSDEDEVSDGECATEQNLKPKARQGNEKSNGDSKARDGGGSGTSSSPEENIVLGIALDGSKHTLPIEEEPEASGALMESEEI